MCGANISLHYEDNTVVKAVHDFLLIPLLVLSVEQPVGAIVGEVLCSLFILGLRICCCCVCPALCYAFCQDN